MRRETRVDYLDIDGKVIWSDPITGKDHRERDLDEDNDDELIWDIVWYGLEDENSTDVVELARVSRAIEPY